MRSSEKAPVIMAALRKLGSATDREVMEYLGKSDPNYVRPVLTQFVHDGLARRTGKCRCPVSGRVVRVVSPTNKRKVARRVRVLLEVKGLSETEASLMRKQGSKAAPAFAAVACVLLAVPKERIRVYVSETGEGK